LWCGTLQLIFVFLLYSKARCFGAETVEVCIRERAEKERYLLVGPAQKIGDISDSISSSVKYFDAIICR
jgi:hypothetical protein